MRDIVVDFVLANNVSGMMVDFGEALPLDAHLPDAAEVHNEYPCLWQETVQEAIMKAGREGDILGFARSGCARSPAHATMFWAGVSGISDCC